MGKSAKLFSNNMTWGKRFIHFGRLHGLLIIIETAAIIGAFWTITETAIQFVDADVHGRSAYAELIGMACLIAAIHQAYRYIYGIEPGLENESRTTQWIARWKGTHWETRLARAVLAQDFGKCRDEIDKLRNGSAYVKVRVVDELEYRKWSVDYVESSIRVAKVFYKIVSERFFQSISSPQHGFASAAAIVEASRDLTVLYENLVELERERQSMRPPAKLKSHLENSRLCINIGQDSLEDVFRLLTQIIETKDGGQVDFSFVDLISSRIKLATEALKDQDS